MAANGAQGDQPAREQAYTHRSLVRNTASVRNRARLAGSRAPLSSCARTTYSVSSRTKPCRYNQESSDDIQ
jgi:hypothetical protein